MCTGCQYYQYNKGSSNAHVCKDSGSFTNGSKIHQNPDEKGTANTCKAFKPK